MYMSQAATPDLGPSSPPAQAQSSLAQQIITAIGSGLSVYNQQKLATLNRQLVTQGKPPVQATDIPGMVPQATVNVGVSGDTQKLLLWGGIGLAALLVLGKLG